MDQDVKHATVFDSDQHQLGKVYAQALLGFGQQKPSWDKENECWTPVVEAELTLSFDHRILDGGGAGRLLSRIAELLQSPEDL